MSVLRAPPEVGVTGLVMVKLLREGRKKGMKKE